MTSPNCGLIGLIVLELALIQALFDAIAAGNVPPPIQPPPIAGIGDIPLASSRDITPYVMSQYANSPVLLQLIEDFQQYLDPRTKFDLFYNFIWNVNTARAWGLDILGRIVGVGRNLLVPAPTEFFGFSEQAEAQPFDQAQFWNGVVATATYTLDDDAYRTLVLFKAAANISDSTVPTLNRLLSTLFKNRGRVYVSDIGGMQLIFVFEFALTPVELSMITSSGAMPKPAAVSVTVSYVPPAQTFGFSEAGAGWQPFGSGTLFNGANSVAVV